MISCTLGEKKYTVDYVTGRALREMEPAARMYAKIVAVANAVMIRWFCILFGNQFTVDDVLDHYPVDRLMHDVALALMAVQTQTTGILSDFPTNAATPQTEAKPA